MGKPKAASFRLRFWTLFCDITKGENEEAELLQFVPSQMQFGTEKQNALRFSCRKEMLICYIFLYRIFVLNYL
ncbi:MAG: hypothetical protein Q9P14_16815, partial [candidate division KSB1 bacterium]|nr:hypothetical protein [candidate division KSB1 bacterium]